MPAFCGEDSSKTTHQTSPQSCICPAEPMGVASANTPRVLVGEIAVPGFPSWIVIIPCMLVSIINLVGGFKHLEKYERQWEGLSHKLWKIRNV